MNNKIAIGFALLAVILNGFIGHFFAPSGILLTPIILITTTSLIVFLTKNIEIILVSLLTYFFVALNDILIKLYSGGSHDNEGLGFINLLLFVGLVPTFGLLMVGILRRKDKKLTNKILAIVLFIALITIHLLIFNDLGLGRHY